MKDIKNILEAALFVAAKPLSLAELYVIIKPIKSLPKKKILEILKGMENHYDEHGIKVVERKEGIFELKVKDEFLKHVEHLSPERDLTRAVMQTLSLVAFKNPIKQSEVIQLRGNRAYDRIKELSGKGFIRTETSGHTNIVSITRKFLDYFGLKSQSQVKQYFSDRGVTEESFKDEEAEIEELKENKKERVVAEKTEEEPTEKEELKAPEEKKDEPEEEKKEKTKKESVEEQPKTKDKPASEEETPETDKENTDDKAKSEDIPKDTEDTKKETDSKEEPKKEKDDYVSPFADVIEKD
ncbi:MAG: SMC-Scp complex subunit ScpB [Candidatus Aenigmarchaeota archaeon]|nr:SMC-Scp complex subunit ScpB [Candidatus Aenigmarchaeota archaeon]